MNPTNVVALQARMNSKRLPGKVMKLINGKPMIYWQIQRIYSAKNFEKLIVVTTDTKKDDVLCNYLDSININFFRGSESDVLSRYLYVEQNFPESAVVRLTADCPLFQPIIFDEMIDRWNDSTFDYYSNVNPRTFPVGLDIEIIRNGVFEKLNEFELNTSEREHVTLGIENRFDLFSNSNYSNGYNLSQLRWTVDFPSDFEFIRKVFEHYRDRETEIDMEMILKIDSILEAERLGK